MTVFIAQLKREIQVGYPRSRSLSKDFSSFICYIVFVIMLIFLLLE